jgi:hypothetical protein
VLPLCQLNLEHTLPHGVANRYTPKKIARHTLTVDGRYTTMIAARANLPPWSPLRFSMRPQGNVSSVVQGCLHDSTIVCRSQARPDGTEGSSLLDFTRPGRSAFSTTLRNRWVPDSAFAQRLASGRRQQAPKGRGSASYKTHFRASPHSKWPHRDSTRESMALLAIEHRRPHPLTVRREGYQTWPRESAGVTIGPVATTPR